jgi:hypothetical protein
MLVLVCLEIVLTLTQDRCTVCAESTIGLEIVVEAPDGSPGDIGPMESRFNPFGDNSIVVQDGCTVCAKHIIGK